MTTHMTTYNPSEKPDENSSENLSESPSEKVAKPTIQPAELVHSASSIAYNGYDRNAFLFGFTPQAELWNGRLAMLGFGLYFFWDFVGYSVARDVFHLIR
jgi:hypothetical protein